MPVLFSNVGAFGVAIATATLAFAGHAPSVSIQGNENVSISQGAATFTGYAPRAYVPGTMAMGPGLVFGLNLQSDQSGFRTPAASSLSFLGYQPLVENSGGGIETLGSDDLYALDATIDGTGVRVLISSVTRLPLKGSATFAGYAPTLAYLENIFLPVPAGSGAFTGLTPTLNRAIALVDPPPVATTETVYATSYVTGTVTGPTNAIGASDGTFTTDTTANWNGRWRMSVPSGTTPSGTQSVSFRVRKNASGGATPTLTAQLWQSNVLVQSISPSAFSVTSATGEDYDLTFDSSLISSFADVDFRLDAVRAGGGTSRRTVQVDAITWTASFESGSSGFVGYAPALDISPSPIVVTGTPGPGTAVFQGHVPDVSVYLSLSAGSGTFTGYAPLGGRGIFTDVGSGTFTGLAPTLNRSILPSAGSASFAGYAPFTSGVSITIEPGVGSASFAGLAPTDDRARPVPKGTGIFASSFLRLAETRAIANGTGAFTGYAPGRVSTGARYDGSGDIASRRATMGGITWVMVRPTDSDVIPQPSTIVGTGAMVRTGSGTLVSQFATINREGWVALGVLEAEPATIWGGGIHRPYLPVNAVDIALSCVEVTIDVNAYLENSISVTSVDASSGY